MSSASDDPLSGLSALADPVRRRLYEHVATRDEPVGREDAATAVDVTRTLAAYHLDRLVDAGLLEASYARPAGRTGPGAGRPAKLYRRVRDEVGVTVPPRDYGLLAEILVAAVADCDSPEVRERVAAAAEAHGRSIADADGDGDLASTLTRLGYEPATTQAGDLALRNCPFHRVASREKALVCGLNHAFVRGILAGRGDTPDRADLVPHERYCCVVVHAPTAS